MMPAQPYRTRSKFRPRTDRLLTRAVRKDAATVRERTRGKLRPRTDRLLTRAVQKDAATVRERTRSKFRTRAVRKDAADAPRRKET
jgi:hypothetical protein